MLLNCGVGEDSWESLGLQGDPTSPSLRRAVLNIHWKEVEAPILWPPDAKNWLIGKDPDVGKDWRQEKETTEDEMVEWHHCLDGHEFEKALGVGDGRGSLVCCSPWGHRVGHSWVTELYSTNFYRFHICVLIGNWWERTIHRLQSMGSQRVGHDLATKPPPSVYIYLIHFARQQNKLNIVKQLYSNNS